MGSLPYRMYDVYNKKAWSLLGARRQNLSRLRVEKLGCAGSRQVIPAILYEVSADKSASISNQAGHRVPLTYLCVAPPGQSPAYTYSLYLPKTALAALAGLCPFSVTVLPSSPACPWVYSPKTAFATLANLQSEDLTL
jgi:hypothetical protein